MNNSTECIDFSARLQQALHNAGYCDSPTKLAREFNERSEGSSITIHAARKWLFGTAIPTQDKIRTLADWLGVTPESLRFGDDEKNCRYISLDSQKISKGDLALLSDIQKLDKKNRKLAHNFVQMLATGESQQ